MVNLSKLIDTQFPAISREVIIVNHHPQGGKATTIAHTHEYMLACLPSASARPLHGRAEPSDEPERRPFKRSGTAESNFRRGRPNSFYALLVDPKTCHVVGAEPPPEGKKYPNGPNSLGLVRVYPIGADGEERVWRRSYESGLELISAGKLVASESNTIYQVIPAGEGRAALFSLWNDSRYNAGTQGANLLRDILGEANLFAYPKSLFTVADAIFASGSEGDDVVLDFFGGSGTTAHAVIALNREDGEARKYALVEMGEQFDTVLKRRTRRVVYSAEWNEGRPVLNKSDATAKTSHLFQYFDLESYEDALDNLIAKQEGTQAALDLLGDEYRLGYWLDFETRESDTLLNVAKLDAPFDYTLALHRDGETHEQPVDLPETFNWLVGLIVRRRQRLKLGGTEYLMFSGRTRADDRDTRVLWRTIRGWKDEDFAAERKAFAEAPEYLSGAAVIYVNGDSALPNAQSLDPVFKARMFAPVAG